MMEGPHNDIYISRWWICRHGATNEPSLRLRWPF